MNFRRLFFLSFKSSKCILLHRQMEFCWGGNKERKRRNLFFKSQVIPGRVGGLHAPQRMIVCKGRVQKGDILDSHSLPTVIIQSTVIKISKLIFLQFQMVIWSCSIFSPNIDWKTTLNMDRHSTREWKLNILNQAALPTFFVWNWIHFTDVWCNLGFCGWCGGVRVAVQKLSRSLPNL